MDVVNPIKDTICLSGMQKAVQCEGVSCTRLDGQDLVKPRTEDETEQLVVQTSPPCRVGPDHLSIALNQRLDLGDCVCLEERVD